ncbi:hypothetical protein DNTS_002554, partial [Danionella cerebrum]
CTFEVFNTKAEIIQYTPDIGEGLADKLKDISSSSHKDEQQLRHFVSGDPSGDGQKPFSHYQQDQDDLLKGQDPTPMRDTRIKRALVTTAQAAGNGELLPSLLESQSKKLVQFEDALSFKKHQTCLKEAALLENFVNAFWWAKEMNFTSQQISFIMALLQLLIDNIKIIKERSYL